MMLPIGPRTQPAARVVLRQLVAVRRLKRTLPSPREISLRFFLRARPAAPRPSLICVTFVRFRLSLVATGGWHYAGWLLLLALHARAVRAARRARGPVRLCQIGRASCRESGYTEA